MNVVGHVIEQAVGRDAELPKHPAAQFRLDRLQRLDPQTVHLIPEERAVDLPGVEAPQPAQRRRLRPGRPAPLAGGMQRPADGGQQQRLADRQQSTRRPRSAGRAKVPVDQLDQAQPVRQGQQYSDAAVTEGLQAFGSLVLPQPFQQVLRLAKIRQVGGLDLPAHPPGLHDVPVLLAVDRFGLEPGHLGPTIHTI
jgi:hypothetical protein